MARNVEPVWNFNTATVAHHVKAESAPRDAPIPASVKQRCNAAVQELLDIEPTPTTSLEDLLADPSNLSVNYDDTVSVPVTAAGSWVVFAVYSNTNTTLSPVHPGREAFGVTNPIFLER